MTDTIASTGLPPHHDDSRCACKGHDPDLWFPKAGRQWAVSKARRICWTCPLRTPCAEWAIPITDLGGTWGALTASDRKRIRVERAASATGSRTDP